jgi:acyl-CoA synthetase (AMP-forming)/AMP-acid ligase II
VIFMRTLERADLAIRRHVTLGDLMERLARVHEDRILVTQSDPELSLTYRQAAKRVSRWAGGISKRIAPGDRVVIATPNTYEFFLLCCAASGVRPRRR